MNTSAHPEASEQATWRMAKNVLNAGELQASLTLLGPGSSTEEESAQTERVLYVAQGSITAVVGPAHYMLTPDETLHLQPGRSLAIRNHGNSPAKLFILTLPSRRRRDDSLVIMN